MLSVQDTAEAIEKVRVIFDPYVKGLAQLVQHQVIVLCNTCNSTTICLFNGENVLFVIPDNS